VCRRAPCLPARLSVGQCLFSLSTCLSVRASEQPSILVKSCLTAFVVFVLAAGQRPVPGCRRLTTSPHQCPAAFGSCFLVRGPSGWCRNRQCTELSFDIVDTQSRVSHASGCILHRCNGSTTKQRHRSIGRVYPASCVDTVVYRAYARFALLSRSALRIAGHLPINGGVLSVCNARREGPDAASRLGFRVLSVLTPPPIPRRAERRG
jgi:hypothetical protein